MGEAKFRVELTFSAARDLEGIDTYWTEQGEAWRGEKYYRDLKEFALSKLSSPDEARRGRFLSSPSNPEARSVLAFGVYRIIYRINEDAHLIEILRFWHTHRDRPPLD
jgi:plasmid stabilization system protein ParE